MDSLKGNYDGALRAVQSQHDATPAALTIITPASGYP